MVCLTWLFTSHAVFPNPGPTLCGYALFPNPGPTLCGYALFPNPGPTLCGYHTELIFIAQQEAGRLQNKRVGMCGCGREIARRLRGCWAQVSTANLERVRRIKNRLVRLTTRVETLREVLEKILDDDSDMHQMNLTARAMDLLERQARPSADPVPGKERRNTCRYVLHK